MRASRWTSDAGTLIELAADDLSLADLVDRTVTRLIAGRTDDVALVAARLHRQDRPRPAEAGPGRAPAS